MEKHYNKSDCTVIYCEGTKNNIFLFADHRDPTRNQNVTVSPFVPEQKSAFLVGTNNDIGSNAGTLRKGTAKRTSRVVNDYQPSYGPNEDTLRRIAKKDKEAEEEGTASNVNPTYIDDDFDDFDDY